MASYSSKERGQQYARQILTALERDDFVTKAFVTRRDVQYSRTLSQLKEIRQALDSLVESTTREPLSETAKDRILAYAADELGLKSATDLKFGIRAANNDDFGGVVDFIDQLRGK